MIGGARVWLLCACLWSLLQSQSVRAQLLSPGDLSRVHAKLEGDEHCLDCHSSGKRVDAQRCTHCHTDIGRELQKKTGLHGAHYREQACGECHVDHRGRDHDLVRWPGGSREKFNHKLTGWLLNGAHAGLDCAKCHNTKNERGANTFIGQSTACKSCHKDPHEGRFGSDCLKCHTEQSFRTVELKGFDHGLTRFPLKGAHSQVDCADCHGAPPNTKYKPLVFETCTSCHKDPHAGRFSKNCTSCHNETSWSDLHMQRNAHPKLSLSGGHARLQCTGCHDRGNDKPPSRGSSCVSCHAPIHEAPFGKDCADCHKHIAWLGVAERQSREVHARTVFPLVGEHQRVECEACHSPKTPLAKRYKQLRYERCLDCHRDPHQGEFSARGDGDCRSCHNEHGFAPTLFGVEAHALTSFPLVGRHQAVACVACHEASMTARVAPTAGSGATSGKAAVESGAALSGPAAGGGARPGKFAAKSGAAPLATARLHWQITGQACADCHANPHGDQFAKELAAGGCGHCHTPSAWNLPSVDHSIWPLTGAHEQVRCDACHGAKVGGQNHTNYRGVPRVCEGCHDDIHAGQFRLQEPKRACTECHDTRSFQITSFDHAQRTGYALEGKHAGVPCTGCHQQTTLHDGSSALRYRLTYRACADCHQNPHTQEDKP